MFDLSLLTTARENVIKNEANYQRIEHIALVASLTLEINKVR
jgi:hypothetical protein